jgi:peptidoglycan/LPS O-acetylase OafA/YrhL
MYLFLTLIGTARLRTRLRFLVLAIVMAFTYRNSRWELLLFFCGMGLAELDLIRGAHTPVPVLPLSEASGKSPLKKQLQRIGWNLLSVLALYLMCQPDINFEVTPGWVWLSSLIPSWWAEEGYRYWQSAGSALFVLCVGHSPAWQRFFNTAVVQYLGKISYAIYLMHGPVMHSAGYLIERWAWSITGVEGYWYNAGFMLGSLGCIPAVIWAADIFWRLVDMPTVKFAKWVETKCLIKQS